MRYSALSQSPDLQLPESKLQGWEVRSAQRDEKLGKVSDVIVSGGEPRYLDIQIGGFLNPRHVLLPVGLAEADLQEEKVWVRDLTKEELERFPAFSGDPSMIDDRAESQIREVCRGKIPADQLLRAQHLMFGRGRQAGDEEQARIIRSEEELAIGTRPGVKEEIVVERYAVDDRTDVDAELRKERVEIDKQGNVKDTREDEPRRAR